MHATGRSRPRNSETTRARILEAGALLFATHGFEGSSIHELAKASGYTVGAIYRHFGSKSLLLLAVIKESISNIPAISSKPGRSGEKALRDLIATLMSPDYKRVRMLTVQLHAAALSDPEVNKLLMEFNERRVAEIAEVIAKVRAECRTDVAVEDARGDRARAALLMMLITGTSHVDVVQPGLVDQPGIGERIDAIVAAVIED